MSKSDRLFDIIQLLRSKRQPMRARDIAAVVEVSLRTIYRDIATLQARQIPILGEPGVGYVMRKGYDLPPINLDIEEAEAVSVGLNLVARTGDQNLWRAAKRASRKLQESAPGTRRLVTSSWVFSHEPNISLADVRSAIRSETKLSISYCNADGVGTRRVIWPLVLVYYQDAVLLAAWCELRRSLRHFRLDRVISSHTLESNFRGHGEELISAWEQIYKDDTVPSVDA